MEWLVSSVWLGENSLLDKEMQTVWFDWDTMRGVTPSCIERDGPSGVWLSENSRSQAAGFLMLLMGKYERHDDWDTVAVVNMMLCHFAQGPSVRLTDRHVQKAAMQQCA